MSDVREGVEVEFECGHRMVYDKHSDQGKPELGEPGLCRQCPVDEFGFPPARIVVGLRQCWIETSVRVVFDRDAAAG
jgi:hypothetical protein